MYRQPIHILGAKSGYTSVKFRIWQKKYYLYEVKKGF